MREVLAGPALGYFHGFRPFLQIVSVLVRVVIRRTGLGHGKRLQWYGLGDRPAQLEHLKASEYPMNVEPRQQILIKLFDLYNVQFYYRRSDMFKINKQSSF